MDFFSGPKIENKSVLSLFLAVKAIYEQRDVG
jgi:hypothetical protein